MVNRVYLIGRLTRDPEVRDTASGGRLSNMRLVTTENRKGENGERKEDAQFHSVVAFGRLAEVCADYLRKGRLVWFEGRLHTHEWDGKDGIRRYTTEIWADQMQMLSSKPSSDDAGGDVAGAPAVAGAGVE